jgi:hypothetical protein
MLEAKDLKPNSPRLPNKVYGVDFSGAKKAGSRIWITSAITVGNTLQIEDCRQAKDLPDSDAERDRCLDALRRFISTKKACAFGLDFPFSLPMKLIKANSWEEFVLSFNKRYRNPESFRKACWEAAGKREERRDTDKSSQTPFSPYNRRLYCQTYYGIREVLAPLVRDRLVCVLPMQRWSPVKPWLLEVCPASTLKQMGLYQPYKRHSQNEARRATRAHILEGLEKTRVTTFKHPALRATILDDPGGDALDSVIAAFAVFRAISNLVHLGASVTSNYMLEGYVYI